ncbi:MAG: hypothetical protein AAF747_04220 [Planctomycetota bacterium]
MKHAHPATILLAIAALCLVGCSSPPSNSGRFIVPAGQYNAAIDASRDVLTDYRFKIERVDARSGIVTTGRKQTAGIATFWDREQSMLSQEFEDIGNRQLREIRIDLAPLASQPEQAFAPDLRDLPGDFEGQVRAIIYRRHFVGTRLQSEDVGALARYRDPLIDYGGSYNVALERDRMLEARIARDIEQQLATLTANSDELASTDN